MKSWKIIRIFSIVFILTLLLATLPVLPASATVTTYSLTLSPNQGKVGDTITVVATASPASSSVRAANFYLSPTNIAVGANLSASSLYYTRVKTNITILTTSDDPDNAGNTSPTTFTIPSSILVSTESLAGGTYSYTVTAGTYYVYFTVSQSATPSSQWIVAGKATLTVTAPTLDPLSPASGPAGQDVVVSGSNFPPSTSLVFKFDTTTLTPTPVHTATTAGGLFLAHIAIPSSATAGAHTISVTAGTVTVTATFTVTTTTTTPPPTSTAAIELSTASGAVGSTVTITGTNFPASTPLFIRFDSTTLTPTGGDISSTRTSGIFISSIAIPSGATAGPHTITAIAGSATDSDTFTVTTTTTTPPPPTATPLTLDRTSGPTGVTINIHGSSFIPSHAFTVSYNNGDGTSTNFTGTVGVDGFFFASFDIPSSRHGVHTITATDGTNTASADFTVESTVPEVPQPLRPYMDEAVSPPVVFDWADVTDDSVPITYNLQIATTSTFDTNTIVINKTGITTSGYTLTTAEEQTLTKQVTYYWREKAVDGALNESPWTGANAFSLSQPFSFTGWPLYLIIGIGASLLFLLGIWIGRRTAYNY
jgi:hypothetical protein